VSLATTIQTRILALPAVTAIAGTRVYVLSLPQSPILPAVRIQVISEVEALQLRGTAGWRRGRVQVDSVASDVNGDDGLTAADALDVAIYGGFVAGVATGLVGFAGTVAGVRIGSIRPAGRIEDYAADNLRQVRVSRDWFVDYQ